MRVGFDLDGVLAETTIVEWLLTSHVKDEKAQEVIREFLHVPKLKNHPSEFLHEDDEYVIITGRSKRYRKLTERWLRSHGIKCSLFMTDVGVAKDYESIEKFFEALAKAKAQYIKSECIQVFFEDSPNVVKLLRKLCSKVRIIQIGGRIK